MDTKSPPRPRGRPREFDRDEVLDRAVDVFWAKGYEGASMDDLTASMKLSRPSVYAAFGDKRTLFLAAIDRYGATSGRRPLDAMFAEPDSVKGIEAFLKAELALALSGSRPRGCLIACVASDAAFCEPEAQRRVREMIAQTETAIAEYLRSRLGGETGVMAPVAHLLVSLMQGLAIRARAGVEQDQLEASIAGLVEAVSRALTVPARRAYTEFL